MNFRDASKLLRRVKQRIPAELAKAHADTLVAAQRIAVKHSSGTFSARGEYARSAAKPHADPGTINVQSGVFRSSWEVHLSDASKSSYWNGGNVLRGSVINFSPEARFMLGTRFMVERPIIEKVRAEVQPIFERNCQAALQRATAIK